MTVPQLMLLVKRIKERMVHSLRGQVQRVHRKQGWGHPLPSAASAGQVWPQKVLLPHVTAATSAWALPVLVPEIPREGL